MCLLFALTAAHLQSGASFDQPLHTSILLFFGKFLPTSSVGKGSLGKATTDLGGLQGQRRPGREGWRGWGSGQTTDGLRARGDSVQPALGLVAPWSPPPPRGQFGAVSSFQRGKS